MPQRPTLMDAINPLFPDNPNQGSSGSTPEPSGYTLPPKSTSVQPAAGQPQQPGANAAADLIRQKLASIYAEEPNAKTEAKEAEVIQPRSKHQEFMHTLSTSGKSLAEIQTEWHNYYVSLPDNEKHQVWQEFYAYNDQTHSEQIRAASPFSYTPRTPTRATSTPSAAPTSRYEAPVADKNGIVVADHTPAAPEKPAKEARNPKQIKQAIRKKVGSRNKISTKQNFQSLLFGIGTGLIVVVIFLFGFFNEVVIAPFIQPNRTASATPIIVDPSSVEVSDKPQIIIPKINVQIPVDYSQTTINEATIENALEDGIVHYPTTEKPGEKGNAAFFGHSSNNIFNKGKYKFAFVLLHELVPGDTFYITYQGQVYIYKVIDRKIVDPTAVEVLDDVPGQTATATLITCDPPGTSLHRLVVVGQQISPNPTGNHKADQPNVTQTSTATAELPGNGPTLWTRLWRSIF